MQYAARAGKVAGLAHMAGAFDEPEKYVFPSAKGSRVFLTEIQREHYPCRERVRR